MKKNLLKDYVSKTNTELSEIITKETMDLTKLKLYQKVKKAKNTREAFFKRKTIAVLKTLMRQKELLNG
ncbi:hypothetical protein HY030_01850 [Candidatus Gottesmanbacteria bacterium]|nr:hypothetical protein [Candidatus Gottesmanbacteria bacterium]